MPTPTSERVRKYRNTLRSAGLRPVQIWVPDTRRAGFAAECRRQAVLVANADRLNTGFSNFMDAALTELDEWK